MGACTGVLSSCSLAGYALESRCHLGKSAVYDTVNKLGWSVDVRTHGINVVIDKILSIEWNEDGRDIPEATWEEDCVVSDALGLPFTGNR
jgi:lipase ATG15